MAVEVQMIFTLLGFHLISSTNIIHDKTYMLADGGAYEAKFEGDS